MRTYFRLQLKRVWKRLPLLLLSVTVLTGSLLLLLGALLRSDAQGEEKTRVRIAVVGNSEESYMEIGLVALESIDNSRFALDVSPMSEAEAEAALKKREISAYVIFPDGFIQDAMNGKVKPLSYVTYGGAGGLTALFEREITEVISDFALYSQKGTYGSSSALRETGYPGNLSERMNEISLRYVSLILNRPDWYAVTELGISDSLGFASSLGCGFAVFFLFLMTLPFALLFGRGEDSLGRVLAAKGFGDVRRTLADCGALLTGLFSVVLLLGGLVWCAGIFFEDTLSFLPSGSELFLLILRTLPVLAVVAAFGLMVFSSAGHAVGGILLHFLLSLILAYVSGCLYPAYALPEGVQILAEFLPTGIARSYFAACITGNSTLLSGGCLLVYGAGFFAVTVLLRRARRKGRG
ncbi:MAG: ABC transporter permease [Clostridia bacterium]|nr:ABC transporter permease [Clostridia bacterium]